MVHGHTSLYAGAGLLGKDAKEKLAQRMFFFWYKPEERPHIIRELRRIGRSDLIQKLY